MQKISSIPKKVALLLLTGLLVGLVVSIVFLASVPPVSRDALTHHLAVPKIYLQQGSMAELPHIPFSYYPMNLDLLYMIPMYFGNDIIPKYIHYLFGLLTAGLLFLYVKKRFGTFYALFAALFFLSLPIIVKLSITVYVDLGLIFFSTGALISLLIWTESNYETRYLVLSSIFCGLALGTKYNGLIVLFLLTLFTPFLYLHTERSKKFAQLKSIGFAGLYFLVSLLVFSPWMIRNTNWTGNPVYPLYNRYFQNASASNTEKLPEEITKKINYQVGHWNHFAIRRIMFKESWGEIALVPIRIFFQGKDNQPQYFDGKLNPFLLFLPLMAFVCLVRRSSNQKQGFKVLWIFTGLFILMAFLRTSFRIRYIAPVIPPLIILSTFGLYNMERFFAERGRLFLGRIILTLVVFMTLSMNANYVFNLFRSVDPISYLSGKVSRDAYITYRRPEYPVITHANRQLSGNQVIMALFMGNRIYYSDRRMVSGETWFTQTIIQAASVKDIREEVARKGYSHILANMDLVNQWIKTFERPNQEKIAEFFNHHVIILKQNNPYALFEVASIDQ